MHKKTSWIEQNHWFTAFLFVFTICVIGIAISVFTDTYIPLWLLLGFSFIFSVEKWFSYTTRKNKPIGISYRLILNLYILFILGLLIYTGIKLFTAQFLSSQLIGSLIFIAEIVLFIWLWRVVSKNSWRIPSMKLTALSLIVLFLILAFANVQPLGAYKDNVISSIKSRNFNLFNSQYLDTSFNNLTKSSPIVIGNNKDGKQVASAIVLVKPNNATQPDTKYIVRLSINNVNYDSSPYQISKSQLEYYLKNSGLVGDTLAIDIPLTMASAIKGDIYKYTSTQHQKAVDALNKFYYEHGTELLSGTVIGSASGVDYDKYQKLLQQEKELEAAVNNIPQIDYDKIISNYIKVSVLKEQ